MAHAVDVGPGLLVAATGVGAGDLATEIAANSPLAVEGTKEVALPVLRHRVKLSADMEIEGYDPDDVLQDVLRGVEAPRL